MNNQEKPWVIYLLLDPRDGRVRYVGKTINLKERLAEHIRSSVASKHRSRAMNWIYGLILEGNHPMALVVEKGCGCGWQNVEKKWIKTFRDAGADLVNGTSGGEGLCNPSSEVRAKMSARIYSSEYRAKIATANHKRIVSQVTRAKIAEYAHRRRWSPETRAKIGAARAGKPRSAETRAKIRDTLMGRHLSLETRAKIGDAHRGKVLSLETRAKMSDAKIGRPKSPEHRAKIAANNRSLERRAIMSAYWSGKAKILTHEDDYRGVPERV